jgi:hypothetical protein
MPNSTVQGPMHPWPLLTRRCTRTTTRARMARTVEWPLKGTEMHTRSATRSPAVSQEVRRVRDRVQDSLLTKHVWINTFRLGSP